MPTDVREPDGSRDDGKGGKIPVWKCPKCKKLKTFEEFGFRSRDDAYPADNVWHKQSWCKECR